MRHLRQFFERLYNFRAEVASACDVISGVVVDPYGMKLCVKFGDPRSNGSRDIRLSHFVTSERR